MRILVLGPTARYGRGGIETQIEQLVPAFTSLGHHCEVLDTFHRRWTRHLVGELLAALRRCDVVLLMGLNLKAWALAWLMGRPMLLSHHVMAGGGAWRRRLHRWIAGRMPAVFNSGFLAAHEQGRGSAAEVVYPCFAAERYPQDVREAPRWSERPYALGFIGRLIPEKGAGLMLQAAAALRRSELAVQVIGSGPCVQRLKSWAADPMLRVHFTGPLDAAAAAQALQQVKVLVIPSLCQEGFGVVTLEGLAAGCHVVASGIGGLPEAGADFATYVPPGDVPALTTALAHVLDGPPPLRLAERQQHLQRFWPLTVARMLETQLQALLPR